MTVEVMSEGQLLGEGTRDPSESRGGGHLNVVLDRALKGPAFTHIRLIDEYGTTVFSRMQPMEVIPELERLRDFRNSDDEEAMLEEVLELAHQATSGVHRFLVFLGD
jgi:hypothetical protein